MTTEARPGTRGEFVGRHIGTTPADQAEILAELGLGSMNELFDQVVPESIRSRDPLALPAAISETAALASMAEVAGRNDVYTSLIGMGYSDTITPPVILRNVVENPAWYTAYTPYQPEISQGRLEALLNFQTMVSDLTAMDLANASLLDEATAAAEAMTFCQRVHGQAGSVFFVDRDCHPQTFEVLATRAEPIGIELRLGDPETDLDSDLAAVGVFGVLVQYPGSLGAVRDLRPVIAAAKAGGAMVAVATDLLALTLLTPPGEMGADVVVGSAQRFGVPLGFGGPHAGFFATRDAYKRNLPGRIVGVSVDEAGRPALRLALQTREQHIRREKATSNICTAQVLLAVVAGLYASYHGPDGLVAIARQIHERAVRLARALRTGGCTLVSDSFFDTVTLRVPGRAGTVVAAARAEQVNLRFVDQDTVSVALDETTTDATVTTVLRAFGVEPTEWVASRAGSDNGAGEWAIPAALHRSSDFLSHPVFHRYHSETEMLRYLRRLADRDLALDRAMIPLGSCTMKLNATTEMIPITWPGFAGIHPFAPLDQAEGYLSLFADLEGALCEITGYSAVSLQPNAGSQGELAGLLAIRAYHHSRGDTDRTVCLIPASAHGTNAASATMAGMSVVVVGCDVDGNVDLADLTRLADTHADRLGALMVTYPSTHGVFEAHITDICELIHSRGGQVYLDGANLNALVGVAKPGEFGADVSHLNLHKTFCIPHGGGGPGVGPVAVGAHLAPFLPSTGVGNRGGDGVGRGVGNGVGAIAAAPWGSAGVLPISAVYLALMGPDGLTEATGAALLHANYVARRLAEHYPVLYSGRGGFVAHECILDLRPITQSTGVTVDDVAKRLIDYGFHAPTMSFPVAGTLMVEPTESESRAELDRFCAAMISIREEIRKVGNGSWTAETSPLRGAPHPAEDVLADSWSRDYSRELAAYPVADLRTDKYWPPVSRIDGAYGDRNVMCSCPPVSAYDDASSLANTHSL